MLAGIGVAVPSIPKGIGVDVSNGIGVGVAISTRFVLSTYKIVETISSVDRIPTVIPINKFFMVNLLFIWFSPLFTRITFFATVEPRKSLPVLLPVDLCRPISVSLTTVSVRERVFSRA